MRMPAMRAADRQDLLHARLGVGLHFLDVLNLLSWLLPVVLSCEVSVVCHCVMRVPMGSPIAIRIILPGRSN